MSWMDPWLWVASAMLFAAAGLFVYTIPSVLVPMLQVGIQRAENRAAPHLRELGMKAGLGRAVAWMQVVGSLGVGLLAGFAFGSVLLGLAMLAAGLLVPGVVLSFLKRQHIDRMNDQIPVALDIMSSGARSGMNLPEIVRLISEHAPEPLRQEFAMMHDEIRLGGALEDALKSARQRLKLPNFDLVATALLINREKGGDLPDLMDRIGNSVRETSRLEKKVKTETASIHFAAKVMAAMPLFFLMILYLMDPDSVRILFGTLVGNVILVIVAIMTACGYLMIQRLANPDI